MKDIRISSTAYNLFKCQFLILIRNSHYKKLCQMVSGALTMYAVKKSVSKFNLSTAQNDEKYCRAVSIRQSIFLDRLGFINFHSTFSYFHDTPILKLIATLYLQTYNGVYLDLHCHSPVSEHLLLTKFSHSVLELFWKKTLIIRN